MDQRGEAFNNPLSNERGVALGMALLLMVVLVILVGTAVTTTIFESKLGGEYKEDLQGTYLADGALAQVIYWFDNPSLFTDSVAGSYHAAVSGGDKGTNFFTKRRVNSGPSYINGLNQLSQFADPDDDGVVDTSALNPALEYDDSLPAQKVFLDALFASLSSYGTISNLKIYAPAPLVTDICSIEITATTRRGRKVLLKTVLQPNSSFTLGAGLQSGGNGSWNGNSVLLHWSDVKIMNDATLPANLNSTPTKNVVDVPKSNSYPGVGGVDAWLDILVDGAVSGPLGHDGDNQPYDWSPGHDNILEFQAVTIDSWDYESAKEYAKKYGTYYSTDGAGNLYLDGGGAPLDFKSVTDTNYGVGKGFVFVDTLDGLPPAADGSNLTTLSVSGSYYTEGKFYLGVNLTTNGLGVGKTVADAQSPPFDAALPDPTATADGTMRQAIAGLKVNMNGTFYVAGHVDMQGGPNLFGGIVGGRGFAGGGNPEVWYDYDLLDGANAEKTAAVRYWRVFY